MDDPRSGLSDALRRLAIQRDAESWAFLVERCGPTVERLAARLAGDADLAADAVQEAWLQIRDGAGSYRARGDQPDAGAWGWIMRVAANAALQLRRQRRARRPGHLEGEPACESRSDAALERIELAEQLRSALAELPEQMRSAIVLRHVEGLETAQAAAAMGCSEGTLRVWIQRGFGRLRVRLAGVAAPSITIVAALESLPGEAPGATDLMLLLHSPAKPVLAGITTLGGLTMAAKTGLALAAGILLTTTVIVASQEAPVAPAPLPAPVQPAPADPVQAMLERKVTFNFQDVPLTEALATVSKVTGVAITCALTGSGSNVTLHVRDMKAKDALSWIAQIVNAKMVVTGKGVAFESP